MYALPASHVAATAELDAAEARLEAGLGRAGLALGEGLSPLNLFVQSFVIMLREGLEAILIVGALLTFLVKTGAAHRRRDIHIGVGAALIAKFHWILYVFGVFLIFTAVRMAFSGSEHEDPGQGWVLAAAIALLLGLLGMLLLRRERVFARVAARPGDGGTVLTLASLILLWLVVRVSIGNALLESRPDLAAGFAPAPLGARPPRRRPGAGWPLPRGGSRR